ncbi:MAG: hypothetical protein ABI460_19145, partial [Caldimonas sp.]
MKKTDARALLNPALLVADAQVAGWLAQVTLRMRREVAWLRHERGSVNGDAVSPADPAQDSLDLLRHHDAR